MDERVHIVVSLKAPIDIVLLQVEKHLLVHLTVDLKLLLSQFWLVVILLGVLHFSLRQPHQVRLLLNRVGLAVNVKVTN